MIEKLKAIQQESYNKYNNNNTKYKEYTRTKYTLIHKIENVSIQHNRNYKSKIYHTTQIQQAIQTKHKKTSNIKQHTIIQTIMIKILTNGI